MSITNQNDTAAEDYDDVDPGPSAGEPAPRPAPHLAAEVTGSDDVEAAYRQWALKQVSAGRLGRDEAVELVPGAARLIDNALADDTEAAAVAPGDVECDEL